MGRETQYEMEQNEGGVGRKSGRGHKRFAINWPEHEMLSLDLSSTQTLHVSY